MADTGKTDLEALARALDAGASACSFNELAARLRAITEGREHTPSEILMRESRTER